MNSQPRFHLLSPVMKGLVLLIGLAPLPFAWAADTAPTQSPLLVNPNGAKPNMMITLDNSGSMAFPYHETYNISSGATNAAAAMRSADLNPLFYDPRITYLPRVDSANVTLPVTDGFVFVSNSGAGTSFNYRVWKKDSDNSLFSVTSQIVNGPTTTGATGTTYNLTGYPVIPPLRTHLNLDRSLPANANTGLPTAGETFTYAYCRTTLNAAPVVTSDANNDQTGCPSVINRTVTYNGTDIFELPTDHKRTDCTTTTAGGAKACTTGQETANILTWFRYHSNRNKAAATSIGRALASPKFSGLLRVGYMNTGVYSSSSNSGVAMNLTPGTNVSSLQWLRGVRTHMQNSADTNAFYSWLYNHTVIAATPLHNSLDQLASYYGVGGSAVENPWTTAPNALSSASNPEMSCRRSFNVLFSDGAWNNGTATNTSASVENADNTDGGSNILQVLLGVTKKTFKYLAAGDNATEAGRASYTPYGGAGTRSLADRTAEYFWKTDFRPSLSNDINTRAGQPTYWQNFSTYTVGYQIKPSGEVSGATSGLTFAQIDNYKSQYANISNTTFTKPSWPTGDLNSGTGSTNEAKRIDDFIQAGYTGGGKGFSVQSSADVERVFNTIVADILSASGNDAGVAVSDSASDTTASSSLKYLVSYGTLENTGEITAVKLQPNGDEVIDTATGKGLIMWKANNLIPVHSSRNVITLSDVVTGGTNFAGNISLLPSDTQAALKFGTDKARIPANNANYINYLRGDNSATDTSGKVFRQRITKLGAMVNPPSAYVGGNNDLMYDLSGDVTGGSAYASYFGKKETWPASLYVATNAGSVHAMNATSGAELGAFFPRRSMKRLLDNARDDYSFEYILDGRVSEHDIYDTTNKVWKHIVMGAGGRGEKLIFGLNAPFLGTVAASNTNRTPAKEDFLWETGPDKGPQSTTIAEGNLVNTDGTNPFKLGHMTNAIQSGQTKGKLVSGTTYTNPTWVALVPSGHFNGNSTTELNSQPNETGHGLLVLNPLTGEVLKRIVLPATYGSGRGLSGVTPVRDATNHIVAAYAGDAAGNMWRFNLLGDPADWDVSYNKPMFTTKDNRPIYGAPMWRSHPKGGTMVVFATGMLLNDTDVGDTALSTAMGTAKKESIYGIWDPTTPGEAATVANATAMPRQFSKLVQQARNTTSAIFNAVGSDRKFGKTTSNNVDWDTDHGWRFELGSTMIGERSIADAVYVGRNVFIATTVISRPTSQVVETCTASDLPTNFIYGLRALTGGAAAAFDYDGDGKLDEVSVMEAPSGGFTQGLVFVNKTPDVLELVDPTCTGTSCEKKNKRKKKFFNGEPPIDDSCNLKSTINSVNTTGLAAGSQCIVTDWSRTQYQLTSPPVN